MARKKRKSRKGTNMFPLKRIIRRYRKNLLKYNKCLIIGFLVIISFFYVTEKLGLTTESNRITNTAGNYNGIDVSKYQGKINWQKVARDSHIQFVYIKASEGSGHVDSKYKRNFKEAKTAGMKVGSYHFFIGRKSPKEQFINYNKYVDKYKQDLIPVVDVEAAGNRYIGRAQLQNNLHEFMDLIKREYGKYPILYSQYGFNNKMLAPEYNKYYIFIARYGTQKPVLNGNGKYNIWQYSEKGKINGIKGHVDLNRFDNGTRLSDIEL